MECLPISACDPDFHHPYALTDAERAAYACDIAFVGTLVPDHLYSRRVKALEALRDFDLGIWSVHDVPPSLRKFVRGRRSAKTCSESSRRPNCASITHGDFMLYGGNLRLFEVAGAGICQISDDLPGTRLWFPEIDGTPTIITYADEDDLRAKAAYYLAHDDERQAIAQAAQAHVYAEHTYDRRAERLDQLLTERVQAVNDRVAVERHVVNLIDRVIMRQHELCQRGDPRLELRPRLREIDDQIRRISCPLRQQLIDHARHASEKPDGC